MAPFALPTANGSSPTSANATSGSPPRPIPCKPVNQSQWGPDSISNVVFGLVMVFISLFAIYQSRKERPRGSRGVEDGGEVVAEAKDEITTSGCCPEKGNEREMLECVGKDEEDGGGSPPQVGEFMRTNTDVTLVGGDEESCGSGSKAQWSLPIDDGTTPR